MPGSVTALITSALTGLGVGAETAGILSPIIGGAGLGAITDPSNPLKGAIGGAATGGFIGDLAGPLSSLTGIGTTAADVITGAAGGALGSAVTGSNPGLGALSGGGAGLVAGLTAPTGSPPTPTGGGPSAAAAAGPPSVASTPSDLTAAVVPSVSQQLGLPNTPASGNIAAPTGASLGSTPSAFQTITPGSVAAPLPSGADLLTTPNLGAAGGNDILSSLGLSKRDIIPAAGLAFSAFRPPPGDIKALRGEAAGFANQAAQLQSYINTGTLPPGLQTAVDLATKDAIAGIKSTYAGLGLSGSTPEAQAIADAKERSQANASNYMIDLMRTGIQEGGLSADLFQAILQANTAQDNQLAQAIASFSAAGSGGALPPNFRAG